MGGKVIKGCKDESRAAALVWSRGSSHMGRQPIVATGDRHNGNPREPSVREGSRPN